MNLQASNRRVLVAHNAQRHGWGGMARMMESTHSALEAFGWKTEYFTSDDMPAAASPRFKRYAFSWYVRRHARQAFLRGEPYDVINIHEPAGTALVLGKSRLGQPAIVATSHGVEGRYWELRLRGDQSSPDAVGLKERILFPMTSLWQSRLTLRQADHVLCLNEEDKAYLVSRLHLKPERISRVLPAAGPEFAAVASRRNYDRPCERLLFSGTWIARKGIRQVIEAFSAVAGRYPSLQLGVLGGGILAPQLLASFPLPLQSRISVLPPLSHADSADALLGYDILLLPSYFEGTPLALIEAMCTGIPVITTATCGMKDLVQDGQNGLLVDPGDAGQIVRCIERLMTDSDLRQRLGRNAVQDVTRKCSWLGTAEVVNAAYRSLLRTHA